MKDKYFEAICVLGEMIIEKNNELKWKQTQLEMRDKEIEKLKTKLDYIEQYINSFEENVSKR
jgi:hypothetical protein